MYFFSNTKLYIQDMPTSMCQCQQHHQPRWQRSRQYQHIYTHICAHDEYDVLSFRKIQNQHFQNRLGSCRAVVKIRGPLVNSGSWDLFCTPFLVIVNDKNETFKVAFQWFFSRSIRGPLVCCLLGGGGGPFLEFFWGEGSLPWIFLTLTTALRS